MTIIIPEFSSDLEKVKEYIIRNTIFPRLNNSQIILSPFVYMNYNDAIIKTCEIFLLFKMCNSYIIDFTGLTVDVFNNMKKHKDLKYTDCDCKINLGKTTDIIFYSSEFDRVIIPTSKDRKYIFQSDSCYYSETLLMLKDSIYFALRYRRRPLPDEIYSPICRDMVKIVLRLEDTYCISKENKTICVYGV